MLTLFVLKAEAVLGVQLVSRHRAVRLAAVFSLALVVARTAAGTGNNPPGEPLILLVAGMLGAVAGSRILAPGGALTALRMAAAPWWVSPVGRLVGAGCVTYPAVLIAVAVLVVPTRPIAEAVRMALASAVYLLAVVLGIAALTPVTGASAAGGLGLLAAWVGSVRPSEIAALFAGAPPLQGPLVFLWTVLPLPWRVLSWLIEGSSSSAALMIMWSAVALVASGWTAARFHWPDRGPGAAS